MSVEYAQLDELSELLDRFDEKITTWPWARLRDARIETPHGDMVFVKPRLAIVNEFGDIRNLCEFPAVEKVELVLYVPSFVDKCDTLKDRFNTTVGVAIQTLLQRWETM